MSVVQFLGAVNIILCTHFTALKNNTTDKMITGVRKDGKVSMEKKQAKHYSMAQLLALVAENEREHQMMGDN